MQEVLKSEQNAKVRYLKKLYHKRRRRQEGKYILEGYRIVREALEAGVCFDSLFMTPEYAESREGEGLIRGLGERQGDFSGGVSQQDTLPDKGLKENLPVVHLIEEGLLKRLADTETPQGVIAVVNEPRADLQGLLKGAGLILVLDRLQDPGNMGTIIRTAAAAGVDGILALKGCVDIYNLKVLRSTMGAVFRVPLIQDIPRKDFLGLLKDGAGGFTVVSTALENSRDYNLAEYREPLMLVIGNEAGGVCREIIDVSDFSVKVPLYGEIESLNAAVACGVILYKIVEKNSKKT